MLKPIEYGELRGADPTGNGWYGASRGYRKHEGCDYLSKRGDKVLACVSGKIRIGNVYTATDKFKLVEIKNKTYKIKQMYVHPTVKTGDSVQEGDVIGYAQDIAAYHGGGMKNHVHISVWKNGLLTDPEPILK